MGRARTLSLTSSEACPRGFPEEVRAAAPSGYVEFGDIRIKKPYAIAIGISIILSCGFIFGFALPENSQNTDTQPWKRISEVIGWIYFAAWSISFYPQLYLNWVRKSVVGMSFDYQLLNLVGFGCYSAFNVAYYYSDDMKADYELKHNSTDNPVHLNDVVFALHAEFLTLLTFLQIFFYEKGEQRLHPLPIIFTGAFLAVFAAYFIYVNHHGGRWADSDTPWTWLDFFLGLSWVKLGISVVKYCPQVYLNYSRKRTTGWNIWNVLLDFTGGSLSVAQLLIDCFNTGDWSQVSGDPVKFGLGLCSMFFDTIFIIQHYFLYAEGNRLDEFGTLDQEEDAENRVRLDEEKGLLNKSSTYNK
eukprot:TRINITY_DN1908_c0_g1_i3.p1 TRINITY_DN1908_c0_g1~~TRINITY_DN1908_c0_g1_i3.p1  ORF type:complete len:358 (+),score=159.19 TRINITY_DN1908_c0_g1_i3:171-1244(+)